MTVLPVPVAPVTSPCRLASASVRYSGFSPLPTKIVLPSSSDHGRRSRRLCGRFAADFDFAVDFAMDRPFRRAGRSRTIVAVPMSAVNRAHALSESLRQHHGGGRISPARARAVGATGLAIFCGSVGSIEAWVCRSPGHLRRMRARRRGAHAGLALWAALPASAAATRRCTDKASGRETAKRDHSTVAGFGSGCAEHRASPPPPSAATGCVPVPAHRSRHPKPAASSGTARGQDHEARIDAHPLRKALRAAAISLTQQTFAMPMRTNVRAMRTLLACDYDARVQT